MGHDQTTAPTAEAEQGEPHQWRPGEVEPRGAVLGQPALVLPVLLGGGEAAEVDLVPRGRRMAGHDLDRPGQAVVKEPGPQMGMAEQQSVHRLPEADAVDVALEVEGELHQIDVRGRLVVHGVEEQPLLQRGQRQCVDGTGKPPLDRGHVLGGEGEQRGRGGGRGVCSGRGAGR